MSTSDTPTQGRGPGPLASAVIVAILCLIWGSTWCVIKVGLADLPPFSSAAMRFLLATAGMAVIAHFLAKREGGLAPPWWLAVTMGITQFSVSYGLVYWCTGYLPSGLVSVIWSTFPLMLALAGHWYLPDERLTPPQVLGFFVGFAGVALLFATDIPELGPGAPWAALILLGSPLIVTVGTIVIKRHGKDVNSMLLNRNGMLVGAMLLSLAAIVSERDATIQWSGKAVLSVLYLASIGSVTAFGLYFWLLRYRGAKSLSVIAYVTPAVALFFGWLFLGESLTREALAGSVLIIIGVILSKYRGSPAARAARQASH